MRLLLLHVVKGSRKINDSTKRKSLPRHFWSALLDGRKDGSAGGSGSGLWMPFGWDAVFSTFNWAEAEIRLSFDYPHNVCKRYKVAPFCSSCTLASSLIDNTSTSSMDSLSSELFVTHDLSASSICSCCWIRKACKAASWNWRCIGIGWIPLGASGNEFVVNDGSWVPVVRGKRWKYDILDNLKVRTVDACRLIWYIHYGTIPREILISANISQRKLSVGL